MYIDVDVQYKDVYMYTHKSLCTYSCKPYDLTCLCVSSLTPLILYIRPYSVYFHLKHCHFKIELCFARQVCSVASKCATVIHSMTPSCFIYPFLHWDIQVFSFFSHCHEQCCDEYPYLCVHIALGKLVGYTHQEEN